MTHPSEWKLAQKLKDSENRGIIIGIGIAALVALIAIVAIAKYRWAKSKMDYLEYDLEDMDEDFDEDDEDCCDENGCCVANEKDFV